MFHGVLVSAPVTHPKDDTSESMGEGYALLTIGITFALTLALFVLGGIWLDRRTGWTPLWTLVGTLAGTGLGGCWMFLRLRRSAGRPQ
jgi:hypothetical protein